MYIAGLAVGFLFVGGFVANIAGQVLGSVQGAFHSGNAKKVYYAPRRRYTTIGSGMAYTGDPDIDMLIT